MSLVFVETQSAALQATLAASHQRLFDHLSAEFKALDAIEPCNTRQPSTTSPMHSHGNRQESTRRYPAVPRFVLNEIALQRQRNLHAALNAWVPYFAAQSEAEATI